MKRTETQTRTHEFEAAVEYRCDLCGKESPHPQDENEWGRTANNGHEWEEISIEQQHATSYPGDYYAEVECFDVCPECWETKVKPWFLSQGARPREYDLG